MDRAEERTDREESKQEHCSGVGQSQSSLGRKSRRACASCSIYFFGSSFPVSANSTETHWQSVRVSVSHTHTHTYTNMHTERDSVRYTGQWSNTGGSCPLARGADVFKTITQVPVCWGTERQQKHISGLSTCFYKPRK